MTCYEDTEDDENGNGDDENKQESKNPDADERKVGSGTPRNAEEPQETPLMQSYVSNVFMTQVMDKWAMSTIEDYSATLRVLSLVRSWMESSNRGVDKKSRNMINVHLAREKSMIEHRSNNIPCPVENNAHAQPSVSHEEDKIQNSNFENVPSNYPRKILKRMIGNQMPKELKMSQKMMLRV